MNRSVSQAICASTGSVQYVRCIPWDRGIGVWAPHNNKISKFLQLLLSGLLLRLSSITKGRALNLRSFGMIFALSRNLQNVTNLFRFKGVNMADVLRSF